MGEPAAAIPQYLHDTYWWAYVHPAAVRVFERQWLVNAILWGNFARLRDAALDALGDSLDGSTLQVACVYGDFTARLADRVVPGASLDVIDVLPIQLDNLRRKLPAGTPVRMLQRDAAEMGFADGTYDRAVLFFLLHEVPADVRHRVLAEAIRVTRPGGRIVIVDYHHPRRWHPLRGVMRWILRRFEPFALDLWARPLAAWLPTGVRVTAWSTFWGGLYQLAVVRKDSSGV